MHPGVLLTPGPPTPVRPKPTAWAARRYLEAATRGRGEPWSREQVDGRFLGVPLKAPAEGLWRGSDF